MSLEGKLNQLCKGDIEIESIDLENMQVDVLFPYEIAAISIELEGKDDDEIIESFKSGVNSRLNNMIDHLNDCKLDE
ncbi:hypothetical protein [Paenibacillus donghaensis]|uniref:Uncharacterized protein n=1 Tax=Paenibacillus donghaensis TaxID=414771 RepID=A0A2Z2K7D8_9BACL|nr:hypothetical protein [Paenibacillus donghaensis]ASA20924.1 hypothetical protein B9T62_09085 [Paenibacillus donghaensis]